MKLIRVELVGIVTALLLLLAALGLGRLLPEGELYAYDQPWRQTAAVYLLDIERGLSARVLTGVPNTQSYRMATLSPDASHLAVTVVEVGDGNLSVLDIEHSKLNPLVTALGYDDQPTWSPDGRWIAFSSQLGRDQNIYKVEVDNATPIRMTEYRDGATQPSWSPDGENIVFVQGQRLYVMAAGCSEMKSKCFRNARWITNSAGSDSFPVWSPDGTKIAFMSTRSGRAELYVMDVGCLDEPDGCVQQNPRQQTTGLGRLHMLTWSAEYGLLSFISDQYGRIGLYAVQPDCGVLAGCNIMPLVILHP